MGLIISCNENKYNLNFKLWYRYSLIDKYEENANRHD